MALFGTDGVRGVANVDLTAELAVDLAIAAAHVLGEIGAFAGHRPKAIVAQDSRASGDFLESAPPFIGIGEVIRVNTTDGSYASRA